MIKNKSLKWWKIVVIVIVVLIASIFGEEISDFFERFFIIVFLVAVVGSIFIIYIKCKANKKAITELLNEIPPKRGIVIDILIYKYYTFHPRQGRQTHHEFYPIVKNIENDKIYVSFKNYGYKKYRTFHT